MASSERRLDEDGLVRIFLAIEYGNAYRITLRNQEIAHGSGDLNQSSSQTKDLDNRDAFRVPCREKFDSVSVPPFRIVWSSNRRVARKPSKQSTWVDPRVHTREYQVIRFQGRALRYDGVPGGGRVLRGFRIVWTLPSFWLKGSTRIFCGSGRNLSATNKPQISSKTHRTPINRIAPAVSACRV